MKKLVSFLIMFIMAGVMVVNLTSCGGEDDPDPILFQFLADQDPDDGYTVNITVQAENATSITWDYGDGNTGSQMGNHSYTYAASGDYTITGTASGVEGTIPVTKTASASIVASIEEIIAGVGDGGKTWVLTQADGAGKMGVGHVGNDMAILPGYDIIPPMILAAFGLGDEYGDEYTFYRDGKFTVDVKNGKALASALYGGVLQQLGIEGVTMSSAINQLPLSSVPFQNITNATWSLSYDDFSILAMNEMDIPADQIVPEQKDFTFTEGETRVKLNLSTGAYIGFFDLTYQAIPGMLENPVDNSFYIIKDVTPDAMHMAIGSCGLSEVLIYPTYMLHLTFVPKQ